jgi:hypothetical protein
MSSLGIFSQKTQPQSPILGYFFGIQNNLLIEVESSTRKITLCFGQAPKRRHFNPIKDLCLFDNVRPGDPFDKTEFTFRIGKVCDINAVAQSIANAYFELGFDCRIDFGEEVAEKATRPAMNELEVVSCA